MWLQNPVISFLLGLPCLLNPVRMNFRCVPSGVCFQLQRATQTLIPAGGSVNKHPFWKQSSTSTAWLEGLICLSWSKRAITESCQDCGTSHTTGSHAKSEHTGGSPRSFLTFGWVDLCGFSTLMSQHQFQPTPCLTNAVLKPKMLKLLPHVKKNLKLQGISTASVRLGKENQENRSLKWLFWSIWKIDTLCAW